MFHVDFILKAKKVYARNKPNLSQRPTCVAEFSAEIEGNEFSHENSSKMNCHFSCHFEPNRNSFDYSTKGQIKIRSFHELCLWWWSFSSFIIIFRIRMHSTLSFHIVMCVCVRLPEMKFILCFCIQYKFEHIFRIWFSC